MALVFVPRRLDHPDPQRLVAIVQEFYRGLYGSGDEAPLDPDELAPPYGELYVGYLGPEPVATVAWRHRDPIPGLPQPVAEVKRMSVLAAHQGHGLGRQALALAEHRIVRQAVAAIVIQTGNRQLAALRLYDSAGYRPLPDDADRSWDPYADDPLSVQLWKPLAGARAAGPAPIGSRA